MRRNGASSGSLRSAVLAVLRNCRYVAAIDSSNGAAVKFRVNGLAILQRRELLRVAGPLVDGWANASLRPGPARQSTAASRASSTWSAAGSPWSKKATILPSCLVQRARQADWQAGRRSHARRRDQLALRARTQRAGDFVTPAAITAYARAAAKRRAYGIQER